MKQHFDYIIEYLSIKEKQSFQGSVKIGIEHGRTVSITEANSFDLPTNKVETKTKEKVLAIAYSQGFNGSVVFVYKEGTLIEYGYNRTFKGEDLRKLIGM